MGTSGSENDDGFPSELQDRLSSFDDAITDIEHILNSAHATPLNEIHAKVPAIEKAKMDLLGAYTMNSLFWMYLSVTGENPKEHGVKQELDRIRAYMGRVKEIEDRAKAPKIDKEASKRFVRNALWQQAHQQTQQPQDKEEGVQKSPKRSLDEPSTSSESHSLSKKKKSKKKHNK